MFAIIYQFHVKQDQREQFIKAWKELTRLFYAHADSLGSRLHKKDEHTFIAYAQWPDKQTWEDSAQKLPESAKEVRNTMKNSCEKIEILFELDLVEDLLG